MNIVIIHWGRPLTIINNNLVNMGFDKYLIIEEKANGFKNKLKI